ncbi:MAG: glycine--tRNA ligase [Euryarchaeota archaeon]|jgi:glycyl-tRNA synthetase|nr:glycine--tRNA ligase [Euryarchaeota archaeon]
MSDAEEGRLERLTGMLKRRGIILPAFEIHGGAKGLYDFGPVGGRLRNKVNQAWLNHWISLGNIVEISCPTVTPYAVLEASGHVGEFSDFLTDCNSCEEASRADTMLESHHPNPDSLSKSDLQQLLNSINPQCPACGASDWSPIVAQNLMFNTTIGAGNSGRPGFLRPETAQGMFTSFPALYRHNRERLPFGAVQVGKGYRNEISPRQGMIRLREFNMAELEYFIDPEIEPEHDFSDWSSIEMNLISESDGQVTMTINDAIGKNVVRHATVGFFMAKTFDFLTNIGIDSSKLRFRQHESDEMAHYASDCWDVEILGSYGWVECVGIAHRGCYDLESHEKATGKTLRARREFAQPKIVEIDGWTTNGATAGPAFRALAGAVKNAVEQLPTSCQFPTQISLENGESVTVDMEHVKRVQRTESISGEWYIPHVVEPAFGIDRIIWHLLDHAYHESAKGGDEYVTLKLSKTVAPVDYCVFPLFEKDGMGQLAKEIHKSLCSKSAIVSIYDASGSIGRRYARADEIGVPICITVDHQSLQDNTVTLRDRDSGQQSRVLISEL